jgi:hypothetical protein
MDKGIRSGVNFEFNRLLPTWRAMGGKLPGSNFRHAVVAWAVENYGVTWSSGCTHYNFALIEAKKAFPELTEGLGRPEGKKGGRKKKSTQVAQAVTLLLGYTPTATAFEPVQFIDEQYEAALMAVAGSIPEVAVVDSVPNGSDEMVEAEKTYTVTRAKDGVVIVSGITLVEAEQLVSKAKAAKKATLVYA